MMFFAIPYAKTVAKIIKNSENRYFDPAFTDLVPSGHMK